MYITDKILTPINIKQTSYFPSGDKLRRIFYIYCGQKYQEENKKIFSIFDDQEFGEFVLCCILVKEGKVKSVGGTYKIINKLQQYFKSSSTIQQIH